MELRTSNGYIYIGTSVRYLMDVQDGWPVFSDGGIANNIENLENLLEEYEFHVTHRIHARLLRMLEKWKQEAGSPDAANADSIEVSDDEHGKFVSADDQQVQSQDVVLSESQATELREAARLLRETVLAEASGIVNYVASDKRYTVEKLTKDFQSLMAPGVFLVLPEISKTDFQEAGKCIAYELPTSGAFHLMRAVEAVLRHYYKNKIKRKRISEPRMWGPMTNHLLERKTPAGLIESLDNIRKNYRNPTQHPDKVYDMDEIQDLLALSLDVTNRMIRDLPA